MNRIQHRTRKSGFTLIEMVVAVAIMSIIAGAALPLTTRLITHKARVATEEEQAVLVAAVSQYFADTDLMPGSIADLIIAPSGVNGWTGPYTESISNDRITGMFIQQVDAWSRPYSVTITGDIWMVRSAGPDANFNTADDLTSQVDITFLRRDKTLSRLKIINLAIVQYNEAWLATDPLPAQWSTALNKLVNKGYLPNDSRLSSDGWGDAFRETPVGATPVVRVESPNMPGAYTGTGGSNNGGGTNTGGGTNNWNNNNWNNNGNNRNRNNRNGGSGNINRRNNRIGSAAPNSRGTGNAGSGTNPSSGTLTASSRGSDSEGRGRSSGGTGTYGSGSSNRDSGSVRESSSNRARESGGDSRREKGSSSRERSNRESSSGRSSSERSESRDH